MGTFSFLHWLHSLSGQDFSKMAAILIIALMAQRNENNQMQYNSSRPAVIRTTTDRSVSSRRFFRFRNNGYQYNQRRVRARYR
jgi:hypothetical protein